jgi:hypothetical protein
VSYHLYVSWLRELRDKDLNKEMTAVHQRYLAAETKRARGAWRKMQALTLAEQKRRDA